MKTPESIPAPETRGHRLPARVNLAMFTALTVLLAFLVVRAPQTAPPAIAEFAPHAVEQITEAPPEQASGLGGSAGETGAEGGAEGTGSTREPGSSSGDETTVATALRCIGDPPRQIEDPQSPPCVPFWQGDNGGATSKGVTEKEINIVMPEAPELHLDFEAFFNSRFQFYGRKIKLIFNGGDFQGGSYASLHQAGAQKADEVHKAFASGDGQLADMSVYRTELARRNIISVAWQTHSSEQAMAEYHPYMWQYPMSNDRIFGEFGEWICVRLAERSASHAGDPTFQGRQRSFGLVTHQTLARQDVTPLKQELERCGVRLLVDETVTLTSEDDTQRNLDIVLKLKTNEVTSLLCLCYTGSMLKLMNTAGGQGYLPEWLITSYHNLQSHFQGQTYPKNQSSSMFGLTMYSRDVHSGDDPAMWAMREVNPSRWSSPEQGSEGVNRQTIHLLYKQLLLLASGIQLAGPNLTPDSFARGLQRATFPNPDHPIRAGTVGFAGNTHSMMKDAAEFWYSPFARSTYDTPGAFCFVDGGTRRRSGTYPREEASPFFSGPCDAGHRRVS